ncbi:hypothetical protein HPB48_026014 [Haemaphysalis longicornis]|uniref:ABC transporter domain-containing protein n=1 Tax=Haemaphysalis longicornis TaxID=44386 RepID=A0A9J6H015_HAELO|nr:hypothetical protein HPB48_026014 [Haemaphysalis longicornis]
MSDLSQKKIAQATGGAEASVGTIICAHRDEGRIVDAPLCLTEKITIEEDLQIDIGYELQMRNIHTLNCTVKRTFAEITLCTSCFSYADHCQVYNGIPALNGLSVKLYQSRVTVLLGHNGAGKTTLLNILTGVTGATSGIARVLGYDATTQRDKIRTLVSYCQQTDIFFENLTCCENLLYFGSLKGTSWAALQATIAETLKVVHLEDKAYCMPDTLSGGMKRRLSLAIAIVSKPKLVILDEPTTGLDAETRRNVWDVVQAVRKEHSVLLSSHDMEEADAIGDSIIVMARGKAVCSGSISFLKKACGVGYKITLAKVPEKFNVKNVLALIHKTVPGAEVDNDKTGEVIIALNTLNHENFPGMFKALEHDSVGLGIEAIGVTAATMKDVYLK